MIPFRIGMIGCGTVGSGVLEVLHRRAADLTRRAGRPLEVVQIAVRNPQEPRHHVYGFVSPDVFTGDPHEVSVASSTDVLVELAGGADAPRDWIVDALRSGKDVVTANKATLAFHGAEIFRVARKCGHTVYYEASVAAAIPIIEMIQNGLVANQVTHLSAILNGTCNYVLTRMETDGTDLDSAIELAQKKGFAEADPTLDIDGSDSAHKLTLLARLLTHSDISLQSVYTEGIGRITSEDIKFAHDLNFRIKLLAIAQMTAEGAWDLRVHPTMLPKDTILAQVQNEFNAGFIRSDAAGPMLVYGSGAGAFPTASSVVADIVRAAKADRPVNSEQSLVSVSLVSIEDVSSRSYVRMTVLDVPGVLGRITSHFGMRGISISSLRQPDAKVGQPVPVVLVTHMARDSILTEALAELKMVGLLLEAPTRIRIAD